MKNTALILYCVCLFAILTSGCDYSEIKSKATTGNMNMSVDENFRPLMEKLKDEFERLNPGAKLNISYKPTVNAITDLLNADVKTVIICGDFDDTTRKWVEKYKIELQRFEIGTEGIAFIVNPDNPVERVTSEDLKKIFTGDYLKWSDIKAEDEQQNADVKTNMKGNLEKIKLFIQRPNSYTYSYVKDTVLTGKDYNKSAQICSTSIQMFDEIRQNKNAIGISNMSALTRGSQDSLDASVKPLRISKIWANGRQDDYTQFHIGLIAARKYPYFRKVILYTSELGIQLSTGLITFIRNTDGQKVVMEYGIVPANTPVRLIQLQ